MVKKIISYLMTAVLLFSVGCAKNSDIEDLQNQLEGLEGRLEQSEAALQASLIDQIGDLQATITALQEALANGTEQSDALADALAAQLAELEALKMIVEENGDANAIYYGNVITTDQFDALLAQGASVVTGDVILTTDMLDKLVNVKLIGGDLEVNAELTMPSLEVVVGTMTVNGVVDGVLETPLLTSVGSIVLNGSMRAPELTAVTGEISSYRQETLVEFLVPRLSFAKNINIEASDIYNQTGNILVMTDFKVADGIVVAEDLLLKKVFSTSDLVVSSASNLMINASRFGNITYTGETVGDFSVSSVKNIVAITAENLLTAGSIDISGNSLNTHNAEVDHGLYTMNFDMLETVTGYVKVSGNGNLLEFDTFNALTEITGATAPYGTPRVNINDGGNNLTKFNAFNNLVEIKSNVTVRIKSSNITAFEKVTHVDNFDQLHITSADDVAIFENLVSVKEVLDIDFSNVTGVVNSLSKFKYFTYFRAKLEIRLPFNQADIAAHIAKNADLYLPFCEMLQGVNSEVASDGRSVKNKFTYNKNETSVNVDKGVFMLYKSTSEKRPYLYESGAYNPASPDPYWTEGFAGITNACN